MRSTCSVYVDAGYLLASAATRVTGTSLRNGIYVDFPQLMQRLISQAGEISGLPVLRVHWYDAAKHGVPDPQQERIGELPKVKLRLGRFGVDGQQKGVDLRIGLDLVAHARNGAADVFVLVSGDDDLTEAVEEAQVHGVQVVVLAVPATDGRPLAVSRHLLRASDQLSVIDAAAIDAAVTKVEVPPEPATAEAAAAPRPGPPPAPSPKSLAALVRPPAPVAPAPVVPPRHSVLAYSSATGGSGGYAPGFEGAAALPEDKIRAVVDRVLTSLTKSASAHERAELQRGRPSIPSEVDRALLMDLSEVLGIYELSNPLRFRLRDCFWERFDDVARA